MDWKFPGTVKNVVVIGKTRFSELHKLDIGNFGAVFHGEARPVRSRRKIGRSFAVEQRFTQEVAQQDHHVGKPNQ